MSEKGEELLNSETGVSKSSKSAIVSDASDDFKESSLLDAGSNAQQSDNDKAQQEEEEWRSELFRLENEMSTLRSVLVAKTKEADDLKKKLGITPLTGIKDGIQNLKESEPFQKTSAAFKDFGDFASKKLGDLRNSNAFKSVEEKVGGAYSNVKKKISSSKSENLDEPLSPESHVTGDVNRSPTTPLKSQDEYVPLDP